MNEFSTYEYVVAQKTEGKWILARIALIAFYILFTATLLLVGFFTRIFVPLLAFSVIGVWLLVFVTWRYVCVEYEYSITSGTLTFCKIFGNRQRHRVMEFSLRDAVLIAPLGDEAQREKAEAYRPEQEFWGISSLSSPDVYVALFEYKEEGKKGTRRAVFYFEATQRALQICRFYNPSATVYTKTRY